MRQTITLATHRREELVDITRQVADVVSESGVRNGLVSVYAQGATGATMVQENWDESVQTDVVNLLQKLIPRGVWLHDRQDGNGDSHLKAGLVGPPKPSPSSTVSLDFPPGRTSSSVSLTVRGRSGGSCARSSPTTDGRRVSPASIFQHNLRPARSRLVIFTFGTPWLASPMIPIHAFLHRQ